eukprot:TRINITY_DN81097_c0_g1_i1.p1 TRINITY_DN81097_c0_g1~~TRINITY_DN81097_c0_g1_i1.p1  ORF type:complete len:334 (-),score=60.30 TRINITY_DN81097_c0_g1_i1:244-1185(-)
MARLTGSQRRSTRALLMLFGAGCALTLSRSIPGPAVIVGAAVDADGAEAGTPDFVTKVVGAAAQGAVAAAVAALLSAFTEPIVNRLLVQRCTVSEAINSVKVEDCLKFFLTTFPTNMLKFPIFEVISMAMTFTDLSGSMRGVVNGWLFCTIMLPVTNYRFRKSMNLPIQMGLLYQAYPPTVFRDIFYGWARSYFGVVLATSFAGLQESFQGRAFLFGLTVLIACVVSSPFNEWRGFWLQPPDKKLPFGQFFKPERYVRSTGVGATIMGISLMVGALLVPWAEIAFAFCMANKPVGALIVASLVFGFMKLTGGK